RQEDRHPDRGTDPDVETLVPPHRVGRPGGGARPPGPSPPCGEARWGRKAPWSLPTMWGGQVGAQGPWSLPTVWGGQVGAQGPLVPPHHVGRLGGGARLLRTLRRPASRRRRRWSRP